MRKIRDDISCFANTLIAIRISQAGTGRLQKEAFRNEIPIPGSGKLLSMSAPRKGGWHRGIWNRGIWNRGIWNRRMA